MTPRRAQTDDFLVRSGWAAANASPLTADLSSRRYSRLAHPDGRTAILMDAPPELDASTPAFVAMTNWLRQANLSAPSILAGEADSGLLLLEDFGDIKVSDLVASESETRDALYSSILDLLILIRARNAPELPCPDASTLVGMTGLADDNYPGLNTAALSIFRTRLETILGDLVASGVSVSLRDFHADNLMLLPDRTGLARLGLLDYQDAFLTHPVYDLVSLLTDARTEVDAGFRRKMIAAYASKASDDLEYLEMAFAAVSAQRNLRILGIFSRAARLFGKTAHLQKLPRVYGYLAEALRHPVFSDVSSAALAAIPEPTPEMIEVLSQ